MSPSTKQRNWCKEAMCRAVRVVRSGEMGYLKTSKYFSVPRGNLERHVKDTSRSPEELVDVHLGRTVLLACLTKEALEGCGDLKIGGQIIHTVKYADDLVLLAKEEKGLQDMIDNLKQDMIDKLTEIGRCNGIEMNVEKIKVMRISKQPFPVQIMTDQKI
jgi:hypothetical protein